MHHIHVGAASVALLPGDRIGLRVERNEPFEPESLALWATLCRPGTTCIDVGAYSGLYAIAAAKLGARAHAFEPLPSVALRLRENIALNGVQVAVHAQAASDTARKVRLHYNASTPLTSGASLEVSRKTNTSVVVEAVPLDSYQWQNLAAMKVDAEHHECEVLAGALRSLRAHKPVLIVEVLGTDAYQRVVQLLTGLYTAGAVLDGRNLVLHPV